MEKVKKMDRCETISYMENPIIVKFQEYLSESAIQKIKNSIEDESEFLLLLKKAIESYCDYKCTAHEYLVKGDHEGYHNHISKTNSALYWLGLSSDLPYSSKAGEDMYEKFIYLYTNPNSEWVQDHYALVDLCDQAKKLSKKVFE